MDTCVPALLWQDAKFDVQVRISCKPHAEAIRRETPFRAVYEWDDRYDIKTRHDCDDIVLPGYIERIQKEYDGTPKIVTFRPKKFDWRTGETYLHGKRYTKKVPSMFSSALSIPDFNIYDVDHDLLHKIAPVTLIREDYCRLVIHNNNKLSAITDKDVKL